MHGFLQARQAQADPQQQSHLRNPSSAQIMVVAPAVIAMQQKPAGIQMLKLFTRKVCQSK
jgi:hypothetical protein